MTDGKGTKIALILAAVGVLAVAVSVAMVVLFTGGGPQEAPAALRPGAQARTPPAREPAAPAEAEAPAAAPAPAPVPARAGEIEPVEGALVELRFRDLAGFLRRVAQVADEVYPGAGESALAMLKANFGGGLDWLGKGPTLLVARKGMKGFPVAASLPVEDAETFLTVLERIIGPREGAEGGVVKFIRFGAAGGADLEVFARVAGGRAVLSADRELLRELSGVPAAPAEDVWASIDFPGLVAAYSHDIQARLAQPPPGVPEERWKNVQTWLEMLELIAQNLDGFTGGLSIEDEELVYTARVRGKQGGIMEKALDVLVPIGKPEELKWLPADGAMDYVAGIDGEKMRLALEDFAEVTDSETTQAMLRKIAKYRAGPMALCFGAGGKMAFLNAMRAPDAEKARAQMEYYMSGKMSWLGAGEITATYRRGLRKVGDVEIDGASIQVETADEQAQMMMAMMPWMFEYQFAYPPGVVLTVWGADADELTDAAIKRPAAGGPTLADSGFFKTLSPNACIAGEFHGLRYAEAVLTMMAAFGADFDLSEFARKDVPHTFLAWKEGKILVMRTTIPRAALKLYGETVRAVSAPPGGAPLDGEDIGF